MESKTKNKVILVILVLSFFLALSGYVTFPYLTSDTVVATVKDKERVKTGESSKYLIFTEDEVFENVDEIMYFKFNSSTVYGQVNRGETYKMHVYGWRIPFMSQYRNIVSVQKVEPEG